MTVPYHDVLPELSEIQEPPSPALGRRRKVVEQTFALNEGDVRHVDALTGFRRIFTAMCVHIPAIREGDLVMMREPRFRARGFGEARVLDVKQVQVRSGKRTVLALQLLGDGERDSESQDVDN